MIFSGIFAGKKLNLTRTFILGALTLSAVFGLYLNFRQSNIKAQDLTRPALASQDIFTEVRGNKKWILLGDEFTNAQKTLKVGVRLADEFWTDYPNATLSYRVSGTEIVGRLRAQSLGSNLFEGSLDASSLKPGKYELVAEIQTDSNAVVSETVTFQVSYPLYVSWTLDWEGYDVSQTYLNQIDSLANTNKIPVTHFFNPRLFVTEEVSQSRARFLANWVKERKDSRGDEIALHLHMFTDLVKAAGVIPNEKPSWGKSLFGENDGYGVLTSSYSYEETLKLLNFSKEIFIQNGLGTPASFRAGGWFADEETLKALENTGFRLDSSGRTSYQIGSQSGLWDLKATTQPYHPNSLNQNSAQGDVLNIWEFPNNGADSYAFSAAQLYERFSTNLGSGILTNKKIVTYLSHPEWFSVDNPKMNELFGKIGKKTYRADAGPVIYITLEEAQQIWATNER